MLLLTKDHLPSSIFMVNICQYRPYPEIGIPPFVGSSPKAFRGALGALEGRAPRPLRTSLKGSSKARPWDPTINLP